jgi:hypothetical protein
LGKDRILTVYMRNARRYGSGRIRVALFRSGRQQPLNGLIANGAL